MPRSPLTARVPAGFGAATLAAVLTLVLSGCGGSSPSKPRPTLTRTGLDSIFEAEGQLHANPSATLDQLRRLGANRVRVYVPWSSIAPDPTASTHPSFDAADPAAYPAGNWDIYDTIIRDAAARGMGLDFTVGAPPPLWARGPGDPGHPAHPQWRPSSRDFSLFMRALGTRYSGHYRLPGAGSALPRVGFWSIWNEPNFGPDLAPQTIHHSSLEVSPMLYRSLLRAAWSALHATGHRGDTIVFGETAPAGQSIPGPARFGDLVPLRFLRALYCVDSAYRRLSGTAAAQRGCPTDAAASAHFRADNPALFEASGFANHPYSQGLPPNQATPQEPDFAELADLPKLERALDAAQQAYGSHKRYSIYSTEFGYQTKPPDPEPGTVSPTTAAADMNWAEYLSWRDLRVKSYDQYLLTDPASTRFASGLETVTGTPKPGYYAYRMPVFLPVTSTATNHPLEVWGAARPSYFARRRTGRVQQVQIQLRAGTGAFKTIRTVPLADRFGYFDVHQTFRRSGIVRVAWTYPHGPTIFSRNVAITLH